MKRLLFIAVLLAGAWHGWPEFAVRQPPGVLAPAEPLQQNLTDARTLELNGHRLLPLARFELRARVLGKRRYRFDRGASLAGVDLALGWGRMSDSAVLEHIDISQAFRWYSWRVERYPIPHEEIVLSSANMHMIAASDAIAAQLRAVREGHVIELRGKLVQASSADGWRWNSSLTRSDSGANACELVLVEALRIL